jgi:hypothetical protein
MDVLVKAGIDLPGLIAFLVVCTISWFFADNLIQYFYTRRLHSVVQRSPDQTIGKIAQEEDAWRRRLALDFGRIIGRLERIFYIYALMFDALGVLTSWVILKAFFGWIQSPSSSQPDDADGARTMLSFYLYIYGNALSILSAILLYRLALVLSNILRQLL